MSLVFSSKARTLMDLRKVSKTAKIPPLEIFTVSEWTSDRSGCLMRAFANLKTKLWIVRSSCSLEDQKISSNAGAFLSKVNVTRDDLGSAIDQVIASYGDAKPTDEVLLQPMLNNVLRSGVAFSHDPNTCSPYRTINWSEGSDTSMITAGKGGKVWQQAALSKVQTPTGLDPVVRMIQEMLVLFDFEPVDCEFAITNENGSEVLWLLQVRPLILSAPRQSDNNQFYILNSIASKIKQGMQPQPFLLSERTVYGVMPDWNPAEMIGIRPKPLALSLYKDLITDSIWAYQRHNYGYRNLRSFPLMQDFHGLPYIDVRLSFNSFVPADLNENLGARLVDYYISCLCNEPTLHDKVEFEIVFSCYSLDFPDRIKHLIQNGFSQSDCREIADSLRALTNRILHPKDGLWRLDAKKMDTLNSRREKLAVSKTNLLGQIYWLIEDIKRYGTLPFAGLARAGFVAVQMLHSLVALGVFSKSDQDAFLQGISTISRQMAIDRATLDRKNFLSLYGHLRPGSYDINSYRYDEEPELYFDWERQSMPPNIAEPYSVTSLQKKSIQELLDLHDLATNPSELLNFMTAAIELRELSKFNFTRNLSDALSLINEFGGQFGFSREDMAYCDVGTFQKLYSSATNPQDAIMQSIERGKSQYENTSRICLPPLISRTDDVWQFEWPDAAPNFITQKQVTAEVVTCIFDGHLDGAIICIPNADPGYDWLFTRPIAGLITAWGGGNSHMAIRASELGLPAVIGAGEKLFQNWSQSNRLHLDCAGKRVKIVE